MKAPSKARYAEVLQTSRKVEPAGTAEDQESEVALSRDDETLSSIDGDIDDVEEFSEDPSGDSEAESGIDLADTIRALEGTTNSQSRKRKHTQPPNHPIAESSMAARYV